MTLEDIILKLEDIDRRLMYLERILNDNIQNILID